MVPWSTTHGPLVRGLVVWWSVVLTAHRNFLTADLTTWISKIANVYAGADGLTTYRALGWGSPLVRWSRGPVVRRVVDGLQPCAVTSLHRFGRDHLTI